MAARGQYSIYLPWADGRLSWPRWPFTYQDGLPARKWSPIQVLTRWCMAGVELVTCWSQVQHPDDAEKKEPCFIYKHAQA